MTLIVFSKGKLYADNCILDTRDLANMQFSTAKKVTVIENKMAIAFMGQEPRKRDRDNAVRAIAFNIAQMELTDKMDWFRSDDENAWSTKEAFEKTFPRTNTSYIIATKKSLYHFHHDEIITIDRNREFADGSGATMYSMCRRAGLTVLQAYAEVSSFDHMVGKEVTTVDTKDFIDLKQAMEEEQKLKAKEVSA